MCVLATFSKSILATLVHSTLCVCIYCACMQQKGIEMAAINSVRVIVIWK